MEDRLRQTVSVLRKLTVDLGIPYESEEVQTLKTRLNQFVRDGEPWEGTVSFEPWGRLADIVLSRKGNIEVTLRVIRKRK